MPWLRDLRRAGSGSGRQGCCPSSGVKWLDRPSHRLEHLVGIAFNSLGGARDHVGNALNGV